MFFIRKRELYALFLSYFLFAFLLTLLDIVCPLTVPRETLFPFVPETPTEFLKLFLIGTFAFALLLDVVCPLIVPREVLLFVPLLIVAPVFDALAVVGTAEAQSIQLRATAIINFDLFINIFSFRLYISNMSFRKICKKKTAGKSQRSQKH